MENLTLNGNLVIVMLGIAYSIILILALSRGNTLRNKYLRPRRRKHSH
jgi:hypothetical protein